jgi:Zn ribbon nucleic-acid-binding protein
MTGWHPFKDRNALRYEVCPKCAAEDGWSVAYRREPSRLEVTCDACGYSYWMFPADEDNKS